MKRIFANKKAEQLGIRLAQIHRQPVLNLKNGMRMDGRYLCLIGAMFDMPFYEEIEKALNKLDTIVGQITSAVPHPFVRLYYRCEKEACKPDIYGNPAWDLGIAVNMLNDETQSEALLQKYLNEQGVPVTIVELYAGILFAKLNDAIINRNIERWRQLAENECSGFIQGSGAVFKEIPADALARLGLPGLNRTE